MKIPLLSAFFISVVTLGANANPFIKGCNNYNQVSIQLLDSMVPASKKTPEMIETEKKSLYPGPMEHSTSEYHGKASDGQNCTVRIQRVSQGLCSIFSKRYQVVIKNETDIPSAKDCGAELSMDADLDTNSTDLFEYKNTDVYPQIFANAFKKMKGQKNQNGVYFLCHEYSKERPGYRVGTYRLNDCQISGN